MALFPETGEVSDPTPKAPPEVAEPTADSRMHLVFGGRVRDPQGTQFLNLPSLHLVGVFSEYESALEAWRSNAQRTVDDAEMKYVIVPLHEILDPGLGKA